MNRALVSALLALVVLYSGCMGGSTTQSATEDTLSPADDLQPGDVDIRQIGENDTVEIGEML